MNERMERLIALIEAETDLCDSLHGALERKKAAVIGAEVSRFGAIDREIRQLQIDMGRIESQCREAFGQVARDLNCPADALTLEKLARGLPIGQASRLEQCRKQFMHAARRVRDINHALRELLAHALGLVGMSIHALSGAMTPHFVYGQKGIAESGGQKGRVLSRTL